MLKPLLFALVVTVPLPGQVEARVFQNQLISLGEGDTAAITHAKQMGYDYINGQPWSAKRARKGHAAGLGVLFNTGADSAKWLRFNRKLTRVNGRPITTRDRANFDKALCMKSSKATMLTDRFRRDPQYPNAIIFHPNYFSNEAIDIHVAYNIELFERHGGTRVYAGVYVDQINVGNSSPYSGPCRNATPKDFATAAEGQLEYLKRLRRYFHGQLGLPMSGNPYRMTQYAGRHSAVPFELYYNEKGDLTTNRVSDFGAIPAGAVSVSLPADDTRNNDYLQALQTAGIALQQGSWFGWFARAKPSQTSNAVQLARALPNWDNLVGVTERHWDAAQQVYRSSNSYADRRVAYGRHPKTGKIFVVFLDDQGKLTLRPHEIVKAVHRVNNLFVEADDGRNDLTIAERTVTLAVRDRVGKGYILTTAINKPPP